MGTVRSETSSTMYKLIVLATLLAACSAQVTINAPGFAGVAAGIAHPYAHHAYAAGIPYAHLHAAPVVAPVAPVQYAVPPPREIQLAPAVAQTVEPVEQHGYSIRY